MPFDGITAVLLEAVVMIAVYAWLSRPTTIRVDARSATFECLPQRMSSNDMPRFRKVPRQAIYRVSYSTIEKTLFVRATGHDMVEIPLRYNDRACEEIAAEMSNWLGLTKVVAQTH